MLCNNTDLLFSLPFTSYVAPTEVRGVLLITDPLTPRRWPVDAYEMHLPACEMTLVLGEHAGLVTAAVTNASVSALIQQMCRRS